jgi:hypothetical protein
MEKVIWKGIEIHGYDYKRMISYLETLDEEYLKNLQSCTAEKGHCSFLWRYEDQKHITDSIDIPACEDWHNGDHWSIDNQFMSFEMSDCDQDLIRFDIMLSELKGQSLSNAIEYWGMANNIPSEKFDNIRVITVINKLLKKLL